jgi:ribosome-associated translation inhibitor RaiA
MHRDFIESLKKVNWTKVWCIKKISREEMMTEALQQLVREFEEKMTVIFQQLVKESEDLKNEVRELQRTCEMLQAEKTKVTDENLKLKNGILHASETMRDFLASIVAEANEAAAEGKEAG